jgi:hypothetical protein
MNLFIPEADGDGGAGGEVGQDDGVEVVDLLLELFHVGRHLMHRIPVPRPGPHEFSSYFLFIYLLNNIYIFILKITHPP